MTQFHPRREKRFMRKSFREASQIEKKEKNPCNFVDKKTPAGGAFRTENLITEKKLILPDILVYFLLIIEKKGETALNHRSHCGHELSIFYCNQERTLSRKIEIQFTRSVSEKELTFVLSGKQ